MKTLYFKINASTRIPWCLIKKAPRTGPFDDFAEEVLKEYCVDITLEDSILFLKPTGAWELEELQDLETNKRRVLWISILDCVDQGSNWFYLGQ